jgi:hypothetical protein
VMRQRTTGVPVVSWREREQRYVTHLEDADPDLLLVALADKVHNARAILRYLRETNDAEAFLVRFNASRADQFWYYGTLPSSSRGGCRPAGDRARRAGGRDPRRVNACADRRTPIIASDASFCAVSGDGAW